jgi:hypothetical protein
MRSQVGDALPYEEQTIKTNIGKAELREDYGPLTESNKIAEERS